MKEGDVVVAKLSQADEGAKKRPVVVLREMPPYRDLLVCGISTQLQHSVQDFDEVIAPVDSDFDGSGLLKRSLIRLGFLAVVSRRKIAGSIGSISPGRHERLLRRLAEHLRS